MAAAAGSAIGTILSGAEFFARLGLPRQQTEPAAVRSAYRKRALQCHPGAIFRSILVDFG